MLGLGVTEAGPPFAGPVFDFGFLEIFIFFAGTIFWVVVIGGLILLARRSSRRPPSVTSAVRVLEERYVAGEITREEFLERRDVLLKG